MRPEPPDTVRCLLSKVDSRRDRLEKRRLVAAFLVAALIHVGISFVPFAKRELDSSIYEPGAKEPTRIYAYKPPPRPSWRSSGSAVPGLRSAGCYRSPGSPNV